MNKEILEKLYQDFEVSIKPGRGNYKYVKTSLIIDRLNKVFEGNWSTDVIESKMIENEVLVHIKVCARKEDGNIISCHDGFGSAKKFDGTELGNLYKSAKSKAIKDAVKNWGVALFLEDEDTSSSYTPSTPSSNTNSSSFPGGGSNTPDVPSGGMSDVPPSGNNGGVSMPNVPSSNSGNSGMPDVHPSGNVDTPINPLDTPLDTNQLPSTPPVSNGGFVPPENNGSSNIPTEVPTGLPEMPPPSSRSLIGNSGSTTKIDKMTMVQEVAIQSKLDHKKLDFITAVTNMYTTEGRDLNVVPKNLKDLNYQDALSLVNFI